jgi:predicted lipoprotein with Yx(FWY)xxD motif
MHPHRRTGKRPAIILSALAAGALLLAACGDDSSDTSTEGTATTVADATTTMAPAAGGSGTLAVATSDALGAHLVDAQGRTLYVFDKDTGTDTSACTGGCADTWPALKEASPTAGTGVDEDDITVGGGGQVAYYGHLLYYFSGDAKAGDAKGVDIPNWHAVDAEGNAISSEDEGGAMDYGN